MMGYLACLDRGDDTGCITNNKYAHCVRRKGACVFLRKAPLTEASGGDMQSVYDAAEAAGRTAHAEAAAVEHVRAEHGGVHAR